MYSYVIGIILNILELVLFVLGVYYTSVALFSLFPARKISVQPDLYRYAVIIPAHNEAKVLPELLKSITSADYKKELISVFVVADGCSDNTADIARSMGAEVIVRPTSRSKGDALSFAFDYIKNTEFDCVAVFDADNIADNRFFLEMNEHIANGELVIQGYVDSKNPYASWISNAYSIWYWLTNRVMQCGRDALGFGCRISGTGFVIRKSVLEAIPWNTETIAEDAEYTCALAMRNIKVTYAKYAIVYDEKPTGFLQSVHQRSRWAKGMRDVQGEYTFKFLRHGRVNAILGLWSDFLYPFVFAMLSVIAVSGYAGIFSNVLCRAVLLFYIAATLVILITALVLDKKINYKSVLNTFGFILYLVSWIAVGFAGIFGAYGRNWYHTKHGE